MTIIEQDSRTAAADRAYRAWTQRGADPHAVAALLPALVGPERVSRAAGQWLSQNAIIGLDTSDAGRAHARNVVNGAKAFMQSAVERGEFAGHGAMFQPGNRYGASDRDLSAELDRQAPAMDYPGQRDNHVRLRLSEMEAEAQRRHRDNRLVLHDDGRLTAPDGRVVETLKVPEAHPTLTMTETAPRQHGADLSNVPRHYQSDTSDIEWDDYGQNRPFFLD